MALLLAVVLVFWVASEPELALAWAALSAFEFVVAVLVEAALLELVLSEFEA